MKTLLVMAWRNLWRKKLRTVLLLCSMTLGLAGVLFSMGMMNGWIDQMIDRVVHNTEGHLKIMGEGFNDNPVVERSFVPPPALAERLDRAPEVQAWAPRVLVQGMLATSRHTRLVQLAGVDPAVEPGLSIIRDSLVEGEWLDTEKRRPVVVGRTLAERLELKPGRKVVVTSQQANGEIGQELFRVAGIFDTGMAGFDESIAYVRLAEAQSMLALGERVTELTAVLYDRELAAPLLAGWRQEDGADAPWETFTWLERQPFISSIIEWAGVGSWVYYGIFFIAMAFGIVNALYMSVGERTREIGVMRAVGMRPSQVRMLVVLESLLLALLAVMCGALLGGGVNAWFGKHGIDLSAFAAGAEMSGIGHMLYTRLTWPDFWLAALATLGVSLVFALLPARRAARLKPVEAIRVVR